MSATEIIVILFGLYIGYWVVSKLVSGKAQPRREDPPAGADAPPAWHVVLNVSPDASEDEIRTAYKTLIGQYHPDKVASLGAELRALAEQKSKEINGAYRQAMQSRGMDA